MIGENKRSKGEVATRKFDYQIGRVFVLACFDLHCSNTVRAVLLVWLQGSFFLIGPVAVVLSREVDVKMQDRGEQVKAKTSAIVFILDQSSLRPRTYKAANIPAALQIQFEKRAKE